jgi:hypothetical protein
LGGAADLGVAAGFGPDAVLACGFLVAAAPARGLAGGRLAEGFLVARAVFFATRAVRADRAVLRAFADRTGLAEPAFLAFFAFVAAFRARLGAEAALLDSARLGLLAIRRPFSGSGGRR